MARDEGGAAGTVVVAFVLGAITGAAVALLMAPASGEETRRMLADKAREGREKASEAARQGREFVNRNKRDVRRRDRARTRGLPAGARRGAGRARRRREPVTSAWSDLFLGVIAFATLIMALIQIGAIVAALRLAPSGAAGDDVDAAGGPPADRARERHRRRGLEDRDPGDRRRRRRSTRWSRTCRGGRRKRRPSSSRRLSRRRAREWPLSPLSRRASGRCAASGTWRRGTPARRRRGSVVYRLSLYVPLGAHGTRGPYIRF